MVTDHRSVDVGRSLSRVASTRRQPSGGASFRFNCDHVFLTAMVLWQFGCQSVVDPGRSMNSARPPQAPAIVVPPTVTPQLPTPPSTNQSGVLRQPAAAVIQLPQAAAGESKYHTVVTGDHWTSIAKKYQLTVQELTDANGMDPATKLQPGQLVYIPEK